MGVLDTLLTSPTFAAGAGLLAAGQSGAETGVGLLGGLEAANRMRESNRRQMLAQASSVLENARTARIQEQIKAAQRREASRQRTESLIGQPEIRSQFQAETFPGEAPLTGLETVEQQGEGLLGRVSRGEATPQEVQGSLLQIAAQDPEAANALTGVLNAMEPKSQGTLFERISAIPEELRTPEQKAWLKKQLEPSSGLTVNIEDKATTQQQVKFRGESLVAKGRLRQFSQGVNTLARELLKPGAKIGTVAAVTRGIEGIRSQIEQAFGNQQRFDLVTADLSKNTKDAILAAGINSDLVALSFALASSRESGKLTDRDVALAQETIAGTEKGSPQSIPIFISNLLRTRNREISGLNNRNREFRAADEHPAFAEFVPDAVFTDADFNALSVPELANIFNNVEKDAFDFLFTPQQLKQLREIVNTNKESFRRGQ